MSDIHDLHPQKPDAQKTTPSKKRGAANESDRTDILKAKPVIIKIIPKVSP